MVAEIRRAESFGAILGRRNAASLSFRADTWEDRRAAQSAVWVPPSTILRRIV